MNLSTRALFPRNYEDLKQRIIAEYSQISTRKPQTVCKVIRGEDSKRHGEAIFKAEEKANKATEVVTSVGGTGTFGRVAITTMTTLPWSKTRSTLRSTMTRAILPTVLNQLEVLKQVGEHFRSRSGTW